MEIKSTTGLEEKIMDMDVPVGWTSRVQVLFTNLALQASSGTPIHRCCVLYMSNNLVIT